MTISFLSFRWELTNQNQLLRCSCRIPGMTGWTRLWDVAFKRADTFVWRGGQCRNDFIKSGWNWRTTTCTHVAGCDFCSSSQRYPSNRNPQTWQRKTKENFSVISKLLNPLVIRLHVRLFVLFSFSFLKLWIYLQHLRNYQLTLILLFIKEVLGSLMWPETEKTYIDLWSWQQVYHTLYLQPGELCLDSMSIMRESGNSLPQTWCLRWK